MVGGASRCANSHPFIMDLCGHFEDEPTRLLTRVCGGEHTDGAVIAMMSSIAAQVLAEREELCRWQQLSGEPET